jgi:hypothetical protein
MTIAIQKPTLHRPTQDIAARAPENFLIVLERLLVSFIVAFACWTLASHIAVALHLSFLVLCLFGPFLLAAGVVVGFFLVRPDRQVSIPAAAGLSRQSQQIRWPWIVLPTALVSALALGMGYAAFWIGAVVLLSAALLLREEGVITWSDPAPLNASGKAILILLIIAAPVVTYLAHAPNIDDAVYVGTAADAVAHPQLPVLSHDVLYGNEKFPLMLPSYAVESYELLIAFSARVLHIEPILLAHAVFPTVFAVFVVIAWAGLVRILSPRHWVAATVVAIVALNLPGPPRGFGCFAFAGLFVGKSLLVSIGIPVLFTHAWKYEESGSLCQWLILLAATIACVGLSASAIFVVPMALTIAAIAGWRKGISRRAFLTFLPAVYPLACGLFVSRGFGSLERLFANLPARAPLAISSVFGAHTEYLFLLAVLVAPFLAPAGAVRRHTLLMVMLYFLAALNPFTFKLLSRFTTRDAIWRILWCVPVAALLATSIIGSLDAVVHKWGRQAGIAASLIVSLAIGYLFRYSMLADSHYSFSPLKVSTVKYEIARDAIAATPANSALLAPEDVAVWVPTFVHRVPLVSVRALYDDEMGAHLSAADSETRRRLRELVSGAELPAEQVRQLLDALPRYSVGLIVTNGSTADRLAPLLATASYSRMQADRDYTFFRRNP